MKEKILIISITVLLILGVTFFSPKSQPASNNTPTTSDNRTFGAVASPDLGPYMKLGGVQTSGAHAASLTTGTTTPVSLISPSATSTIDRFFCYSDTSTSSATFWVLARATGPNATTTPLGTGISVPANTRAFILASSSPATNGLGLIPPFTRLTWGIQGGSDTGGLNIYTPGGACSAIFTEVR